MANDTPSRPLTDSMLAVLQYLAQTGDRALVRLHSQWWARESDLPMLGALGSDIEDPQGRPVVSTHWGKASPPLCTFQTATVNAMVARGLLKKVGPKRPLLSGATGAKDHRRAELTSAGTARREEIEEQAQAAYEGLLRTVKGPPGA